MTLYGGLVQDEVATAHEHADTAPIGASSRSRRQVKPGRMKALTSATSDLDRAIAELGTARRELALIPEGLTKRERRREMIEPLARIGLAGRWLAELQRQHGDGT
jgi:hypothetical protein